MDFEQQKPITDEYRRNWERIYAQQEARKTQRNMQMIAEQAYRNGCPILEDQCHSSVRPSNDISRPIAVSSNAKA